MTSKVPLVTVMTKAKAKAKARILAKANPEAVVLKVCAMSFVIRARANLEPTAVIVTTPRILDVRLQEL